MKTVKYIKLDPDAIPFKYTRDNDACMDMHSLISYILYPNESKVFPTGIAVEIPKGYEGIIRGRSGLNSKGIKASIGTIDEEYRGDIGVILTNHTYYPFPIKKGNRIAQFTIKPVYRFEMIEADATTESSRGISGFGSSGV